MFEWTGQVPDLATFLTTAVPETGAGPLSVALNFALAPREVSLAVIVFKGPVRMVACFITTVLVSTVWARGVVGWAERLLCLCGSRGGEEGEEE